MSKVPPILLEKLAQLRQRERLLLLLWGAARLFSFVLAVFLLACLVDWLFDMWEETPWGLRLFMFLAQLVLAGLAVVLLLAKPQMRRLGDEKLALWVEEKRPDLEHRLISALELNRAGARTKGMSPELLAAMTREAEDKIRPIAFAEAADHSRVQRSFKVFVPVVVLALLLFLIGPSVALALVQRQFLSDVDIPRSVSVISLGQEVWPGGEEVLLEFKVKGPGVTAGRSGSVRVRANDGRSFSVPLSLETPAEEDTAIYVAKVPPGNIDFSFMAKVGDARTRGPGHVFYVPRPSIVKQDAYVILPDYIGLRPDGNPYEQHHIKGDILGMPGLKVRVAIQTQKPIVRAVLQTYGSPYPDMSAPSGLSRGHEVKCRLVAALFGSMMNASPAGPLGGLSAAAPAGANVPLRRFEQKFANTPTSNVEWTFELAATETTYHVAVFDEYGFSNKPEAVRAVKIDAEPPPTVVLHTEGSAFQSRAKASSLLDLEGMPLRLSDEGKPGPLPVSYEAFGPYGIGKAQLTIGVIRGGNDSEGDAKKPKLEIWRTLPLAEVKTDSRVFDKSKGAFEDSPSKEPVPFYAVPSKRPAVEWPRVVAGGRLDYQPAGLLDDDGIPFAFKLDDQIVVYVEVFNQNPDPKKALVGKSRLREKDLVSSERFVQWLSATLQEADRIEALMFMQQQVYDRPWLSIFGTK